MLFINVLIIKIETTKEYDDSLSELLLMMLLLIF